MKLRRAIALAIATLMFGISVLGQRGQFTFQNLDFEAARMVFNPNLATTNALPGWSAFSGTNELASVYYNQFAFFPEVGLYGSNSFVISGYFGVLLRVDGAISQTGMVPADAKSLLFKGSWSSLTPLGLSFGGESLSYTAISNTANYALYGADVSMFAGQTTPITFRAPSSSLYFLAVTMQLKKRHRLGTDWW